MAPVQCLGHRKQGELLLLLSAQGSGSCPATSFSLRVRVAPVHSPAHSTHTVTPTVCLILGRHDRTRGCRLAAKWAAADPDRLSGQGHGEPVRWQEQDGKAGQAPVSKSQPELRGEAEWNLEGLGAFC